MQPANVSSTPQGTHEITLDSLTTLEGPEVSDLDTYAPVTSAMNVPMFMWPLLWASEAQAADVSFSIIERIGTYVNGQFTGKIRARMRIPNLEKTLSICTGEDLATYSKFPGVMDASYSNGKLNYVLQTDDIGFINVRDFGYSLATSIDRTKQMEGITSVTWTNAGIQPKENKSGETLTNFIRNDGGWIFKLLPGSDDLYDVTWYTTSVVNPETLQTGSAVIPSSTISSQTLKNAEAVMRVLAAKSANFLKPVEVAVPAAPTPVVASPKPRAVVAIPTIPNLAAPVKSDATKPSVPIRVTNNHIQLTDGGDKKFTVSFTASDLTVESIHAYGTWDRGKSDEDEDKIDFITSSRPSENVNDSYELQLDLGRGHFDPHEILINQVKRDGMYITENNYYPIDLFIKDTTGHVTEVVLHVTVGLPQ